MLNEPQVYEEGVEVPASVDQGATSSVRPWYRQPLLIGAMCAGTWVLFIWQWIPVVGALSSPCDSGLEGIVRFVAVAFNVPDTPIGVLWRVDQLDMLMGVASWLAPLRASMMHSGLVPTLIFTSSIWQAGRILENTYGPLGTFWHVLLAAWGAATMQLVGFGATLTVTGPAVACGLQVALAWHTWKATQLLLASQAEAQLAHGSEASPLSQDTQESIEFGSQEELDDAEDSEVSALLTDLPNPITRALLTTLGAALLFGYVQQALGLWGVFGGCLGGWLAAVTILPVLTFLRWVVGVVLITLSSLLPWLYAVFGSIPARLLRFVVVLVTVVWTSLVESVAGFRRLS
mmetsp:Transcript_5443/g.9423  ORF Transcript_5443/g.9423 Transcript_5443/m.9423 type:complete len:346 (-) Transcript_5443:375-1412(-)